MDSGLVRDLPGGESKDARELKEGGDLGAVVKVDTKVDPTEADEPGKGEPKPKRARKASKDAADPDDLREEIADLQAKVDLGQATPKQKCRIVEAQAEFDAAD